MPNGLQLDPTRTITLRGQHVAEMTRRFKIIRRAVQHIIDTLDVLGLKETPPVTFNVSFPEKQAWRFRTDAEKVDGFNTWFSEQVDAEILTVDAMGDPWTSKRVGSAYKQGSMRAYTDTHKEALADTPQFYAGSREQFLLSSFNHPERVSKLKFLYTRSFTELKGITAVMGQQVGRHLADGIVHGLHPSVIARNMSKSIDKITRTRANVMARTEIIAAHAEGQLDSFDELSVKELQVMAEWSTAGDDRVCDLCMPLEGTVMTVDEARGLLPRHPNCRCAWMPANVGEKDKAKFWSKKQKQDRIRKSLRAELPKKTRAGEVVPQTTKVARARSVWLGKDVKWMNPPPFIPLSRIPLPIAPISPVGAPKAQPISAKPTPTKLIDDVPAAKPQAPKPKSVAPTYQEALDDYKSYTVEMKTKYADDVPWPQMTKAEKNKMTGLSKTLGETPKPVSALVTPKAAVKKTPEPGAWEQYSDFTNEMSKKYGKKASLSDLFPDMTPDEQVRMKKLYLKTYPNSPFPKHLTDAMKPVSIPLPDIPTKTPSAQKYDDFIESMEKKYKVKLDGNVFDKLSDAEIVEHDKLLHQALFPGTKAPVPVPAKTTAQITDDAVKEYDTFIDDMKKKYDASGSTVAGKLSSTELSKMSKLEDAIFGIADDAEAAAVKAKKAVESAKQTTMTPIQASKKYDEVFEELLDKYGDEVTLFQQMTEKEAHTLKNYQGIMKGEKSVKFKPKKKISEAKKQKIAKLQEEAIEAELDLEDYQKVLNKKYNDNYYLFELSLDEEIKLEFLVDDHIAKHKKFISASSTKKAPAKYKKALTAPEKYEHYFEKLATKYGDNVDDMNIIDLYSSATGNEKHKLKKLYSESFPGVKFPAGKNAITPTIKYNKYWAKLESKYGQGNVTKSWSTYEKNKMAKLQKNAHAAVTTPTKKLPKAVEDYEAFKAKMAKKYPQPGGLADYSDLTIAEKAKWGHLQDVADSAMANAKLEEAAKAMQGATAQTPQQKLDKYVDDLSTKYGKGIKSYDLTGIEKATLKELNDVVDKMADAAIVEIEKAIEKEAAGLLSKKQQTQIAFDDFDKAMKKKYPAEFFSVDDLTHDELSNWQALRKAKNEARTLPDGSFGFTKFEYPAGIPSDEARAFVGKSKSFQAKPTNYEQKKAFETYQGSSYRSINTYLREGGIKPGGGYKWNDIAEDIIKPMDAAFENAPGIKQNVTAWRGVRNFREVFGSQSPSKLVGTNFVEKGYMSTTLDSSKASSGFGGSSGTLIEIRVPKGSKTVWIDLITEGNYGESEMLFPRGSIFKIIEASADRGKVVLEFTNKVAL